MNNAIFYAQYFNILYQCLRFSAFRNVHRPRKQIAKREKNKYLPCILLYKRRCSQSVGRTTNFCLSHFDTPHGCLRNNRRRNLCVYERDTFGALLLCVKKINMITTLARPSCVCVQIAPYGTWLSIFDDDLTRRFRHYYTDINYSQNIF